MLVPENPGAPVERPTRFAFTAPDEAAQITGSPVVSPDGHHIAFVARNGAAGSPVLWVRSLDSTVSRRINGTDGAMRPFWSPDGRFIGFGVPSEGRLKKVELATAIVQNIANTRDSLEGGTWGPEDVIVFAPDNRVVLQRVPASGGASQPVTTLDDGLRRGFRVAEVAIGAARSRVRRAEVRAAVAEVLETR